MKNSSPLLFIYACIFGLIFCFFKILTIQDVVEAEVIAEVVVIEEPKPQLRGLKEICLNNVVYYKYKDSISPKFISKTLSNKPRLEEC